jgi:peptidyl-prolyl cis-trans isomerase A (cyclophilin A)
MLFEKITVDETALFDRTRTEISVYRRVRIFNAHGFPSARVRIPYVNRRQKVTGIEGRTVYPDGREVPLGPGNTIEETVFDTRGTRVEQTSFEMPGVTDDCIIEYRFAYTIDGDWTSRLSLNAMRWRVQKDIPCNLVECRWKVFRGRGMEMGEAQWRGEFKPEYLAVNADCPVEVEAKPDASNPVEIDLVFRDLPAYVDEPHSTPMTVSGTMIYLYYTEPDYWSRTSRRLHEYAGRFSGGDLDLDLVLENARDLLDAADTVRAVYHWLQDNIYNTTYLDAGQRHEENRSVSDMARRGYGTQQDINYAFWDLLRQAGIEAGLAFATDRNEHWFIDEGNFWQFNRTLVAVPESEGLMRFYSPGDYALEPARVPWFNESSVALIVYEDGYSHVELPQTSPGANETVRLYTLNLDQRLSAAGGLVEAISGHRAREISLEESQSGRAQVLQEMVGRFRESIPHVTLSDLEFDNPGSGEAPVLRCRLEYEDRLPRAGKRALLRPLRYMTAIENPFTADRRRSDVMFEFAERQVESVEIRLPEGWAVESVPENVEFRNEAGQCGVTFFGGQGRIYAQRLFVLSQPVVAREHYGLVRELFEHAAGLQAMAVMLRHASSAGSNPRVIVRTELGDIEVEVYENRAPLTAGNFLRYVREERFEGATFYRTVKMGNQPGDEIKIEVIQGGLGNDPLGVGLAPIDHETTAQTGLRHLDGTISMARAAPGTASSEIFICIGGQPELDFGGKRNPDGQGFAAFGRVVRGMDVVRDIQAQPAEGQMLEPEIEILGIEELQSARSSRGGR